MKSIAKKNDPILTKVREICLSLPDTKLTMTWGCPHFRVKEKIFCGYGTKDGVAEVGFKLEKPHAARVLKNPRFRVAPYVGKHGWVHMVVTKVKDWGEVRRYIEESYELIAPTRSLLKIESGIKNQERRIKNQESGSKNQESGIKNQESKTAKRKS